jgi:hypothetical protein
MSKNPLRVYGSLVTAAGTWQCKKKTRIVRRETGYYSRDSSYFSALIVLKTIRTYTLYYKHK